MIEIIGLRELQKTADNITRNTVTATRTALNTSAKWGRTRIREDIGSTYNIKLSRLYASDRKRGLNVNLATNTKLQAEITAGNMPVSLHQYNGSKTASEVSGYTFAQASSLKTRKSRILRKPIRRSAGINVQIKKGSTQLVRSAFRIAKFGNVVFARGQYSKTAFQFRHGNRVNKTGADTPIEGLNSNSVATMALYKAVQNKYATPIQDKFATELQRQLKRLL